MGWTTGAVEQSVVFHYSEDSSLTRFEPHVPRTNPEVGPAVWGIDEAHASLYWFPRDCPRVAVWADDAGQRRRLQQLFGGTGSRVHAAPDSWSDEISSCRLYEYRFDAADFDPWLEAEGQWISRRTVAPLSVVPVGDLLLRQCAAGVDLRLVQDLRALRDLALHSGLPFSIVRYRA